MFLPLMPKGVEHLVSGAVDLPPLLVFLPLMPKGVEHMGSLVGESQQNAVFGGGLELPDTPSA